MKITFELCQGLLNDRFGHDIGKIEQDEQMGQNKGELVIGEVFQQNQGKLKPRKECGKGKSSIPLIFMPGAENKE